MRNCKVSSREGIFILIFIYPLSDNYIIPSPFYFDLTSVGTTIITINLDKYNEMETGIVEIEILDENNEPLKDRGFY